MSGVNNVNITLLKQYQEDFSVEKDNFNNSSYNYFLISYIPQCSDYYVGQMSKTLDNLYDKIKTGYYNINEWWIDYNNSIEEVEDSLMDSGIKPTDVIDNFGDVNAGAVVGAAAASAAAVGGFFPYSGVDDTGNYDSSKMNLNNMDASTTGATTSSNTQSLWSSFSNWVSNAVKDTGAWISNAWNTTTNWISEKTTQLKDTVISLYDKTGAFLSNAWNSFTGFVSNLTSDLIDGLQTVGASITNAFISLTKGVVSLVEAVGDLFVLAVSGIGSVGTLIVDGWNCIFNGQEGLVATNGLWNETKKIVAYNWTDKIYDSIYATEFGQSLDEHAIDFFKSDGMGCQILEGIGYAAGVVALSVFTFGAATPLVLGGTAAATGFSKYTAQEWNENSLTISYDGQNSINIALDYQEFLDLKNLKDGESRDFTQAFIDENGNQSNITFTVTKNGSNNYSVVDNYGNNLVFAGLNESDTAKGLALGAVYGIWEGLQYGVGAKIGTSTFSGITSNITNTAAQKLAVSGLRVASDTLTGVVEVPFQSAVTTLADGVSFSEAWEQNGGFNSVLTQAGIAGIGSALGEAFDLGKALNDSKTTSNIRISEQELQAKIDQYNELIDFKNSNEYLSNNNVIKNGASNSANPIIKSEYEKIDKEIDALEDELVLAAGNISKTDVEISDIADNVEEELFDYSDNKSTTVDLFATDKILSDDVREARDALNQIKSYLSFSKVFDASIKQLSDYYGDAGKFVNIMLLEGKTVKQILDEINWKDKIDFQEFLQNTREGQYLSRLSADEMRAITTYTGGSYNKINGILREKNFSGTINGINAQKFIDNIDSAIAKYGGLDEATEIYRAVGINAFKSQNSIYAALFKGIDINDLNQVYSVLKTLEGKNFSDLGYMSTSPAYSASFAKYEAYPIVLDIIADKGTPGAYVNQISRFYNTENEFLLNRGTVLQMVEVLTPQKDVNGLRKIIIKCVIK